MQPKMKKGGMAPKKLSGGAAMPKKMKGGEKTTYTDAEKGALEITKEIDQDAKTMTICVTSKLPEDPAKEETEMVQEKDENDELVFNEDGSPKMIPKPDGSEGGKRKKGKRTMKKKKSTKKGKSMKKGKK